MMRNGSSKHESGTAQSRLAKRKCTIKRKYGTAFSGAALHKSIWKRRSGTAQSHLAVGRSRKKGRVALQERRVLRLDVLFGKTTSRMTTTSTTTANIQGKRKEKEERG
jgi:hypothetical protein